MTQTSTENRTYTRGTKIARRTTAKLLPGDVVLTLDSGDGRARNVATKTGTVLRTVERTEPYMEEAHGFYGRRTRRYAVHFTDGTKAPSLAPAETWSLVVA